MNKCTFVHLYCLPSCTSPSARLYTTPRHKWLECLDAPWFTKVHTLLYLGQGCPKVVELAGWCPTSEVGLQRVLQFRVVIRSQASITHEPKALTLGQNCSGCSR